MAIVRWDPFGETLRMRRDMDRIFSRLGQGGQEGSDVAWMPKIDVKRSGEDVVVRAELPGLKPEEVDIQLRDNVLTISGERKTDQEREDEGWLVRESSYGTFERSLTIPESVDPGSITADFNDGVLEVRVPKALETTQPQTTKIPISGQTRMQMGAGEQQGTQGMQQGQQGMQGQQGVSEQGMTEEEMRRRQAEQGQQAQQGQQTQQGQQQETGTEERQPAGVGGRKSGEGWV